MPSIQSAGPVDPALIDDLVAASRILAKHGVLDAWGHVSMRHPKGVPGVPVSVASRKRSLIVCPLTFGPRFATVVR